MMRKPNASGIGPATSDLLQSALLLAMLSILTLTGLCLKPAALSAQSRRNNLGKNFYVAFGQNLGGDEADNLMAIYVTSRTAANGNVSVPAIGFSQAFTTVPGTITRIVLPSDLNTTSVEITRPGVVLPGMAVHVTADTDVAVYGMNHKTFSSDAFMALPVNVLGTEYRAMSFPTSNVGQDTPGEVLIVGVQDSTHVTITPNAATSNGLPKGKPFNLILGVGEVYMMQGDAFDSRNDLTGSLVTSDQPIAVFSGHVRTEIPQNATNIDGQSSRDHLIEQIPPVSAWGDSAIVVPYATAARPDLVRIVSAEDGNTITVNGAVVATLNAGQFYQITTLTGVTSINATNPILVGQYMHTSWGADGNRNNPPYGDPALALVFPVEQFDTAYTIMLVQNAQAFSGNFVNVVVDAAGVPSMTVDGALVPAGNFKPIPGSGFVYAQLALSQNTHNLSCQKPFGTTVYALGNFDSYAYTGGTQIKTITPLKTLDYVIDFGDRLLKPDLSGAFDSIVPLTNISSDPVGIFGFPRHLQDTAKFYVTNPTASQQAPYTLAAGASASMTIEFNPQELNRRMHTQVIAKTVHLRAYVVDVYGRGVIDQPQTYSGLGLKTKIDTVDFGVFAATDPPRDTIIYVGNIGSGKTSIASLNISGNDQTYFQSFANKLPFDLDTGRSSSDSAIRVRFTPGAPNGLKVGLLTVLSKNGMKKDVVLLAHIETVSVTSLSVPAFDTILTCKTEDKTITLTNPNDVAVRVDSVILSGANAADYKVQSSLPITIGPGATVTVTITFAPSAEGIRAAKCTAYFSTPVGASQSAALTGIGAHIGLQYASTSKIHILGGESFELPIYSIADLGLYHANGYTLQLSYDSTNITFQDVDQNATHSYFGYFLPSGTVGHELLTYQCITDSLLWGGGAHDTIPLIYLKFSSTINGLDPTTFNASIAVNYDVELVNANVSGPCLLTSSTAAVVTLDSTCATVHLVQPTGDPTAVALEQNHPNPFNPSTVIDYEIPHEGEARIEVTDMLGRNVSHLLDAWKKPGHYSIRFDASNLTSGIYNATLYTDGVIKTRRMILAR